MSTLSMVNGMGEWLEQDDCWVIRRDGDDIVIEYWLDGYGESLWVVGSGESFVDALWDVEQELRQRYEASLENPDERL